jgi:squalene-hopene/tetraprenyl-beta-curcumene cyclase
MMQRLLQTTTVLAVLAFAAAMKAPAADAVAGSESWSAAAAAGYLDARAQWWSTWPPAARDHGTFCISCHTAVPYALGRGALRVRLGEQGPAPAESELIDDIVKRVRMWNEVTPVYTDAQQGARKSAESRGTEAVLYALILAAEDSRAGRLSGDTRTALDNMWAIQNTSGPAKGAWTWLNFHNEPWEADDSQFWGTTLAAMAVSIAPEGYASLPANRERVAMMVQYLRANAAGQSLLNRAWLMWASAKLPALASKPERQLWADQMYALQEADGGWSTSSLVVSTWKRHDGTPMDTESDGYATALAVLALEQSGTEGRDERIARGLQWLEKNQDANGGGWPAMSLNEKRDPASDVGRFMRDAATGYAVLALTSSPRTSPSMSRAVRSLKLRDACSDDPAR